MKKAILVAGLLLTSLAFGQSPNNNELNANLGFTSGALAIGADYAHPANDVMGWGGYFFLQTEKDKASIQQVLALGGMLKIHVLKRSNVEVYVSPGFGLAIINDVPNGTGSTDDKTVVGPSMKIGAQYYVSPKVKVGVERFMLTNWFDDEAPGSAEYTTAVIGFEF